MERLAPDARRSGSAAEGSMKKKTSGNEELSVFHCPQHSVLWPNCLTPWFRCLAALCDGDHFWKLLEASWLQSVPWRQIALTDNS